MKNIYLFCFVPCFLVSCQKNEMKTYDGENYIQFSKTLKDTTTFSFSFYPGINDYELPVVVEMSGSACQTEMTYRIVVDQEKSTVEEGKHFSLPEKNTFKAGTFRDTCHVKLMRRDEMKAGNLRLVLRLESNESFQVGEVISLTSVILVNDKLSKPVWWNNNITWYYLGAYSDRKYILFIEATRQHDLTGISEGRLRDYCLRFKYWLQDQGITDVTVPVKG